MPTGRVVGVLQRNWRDYVASFSEDEVTFLNTIQYCYSRGVPFSLPSKILCQHSKCGTQTVPSIWVRAPLLPWHSAFAVDFVRTVLIKVRSFGPIPE